MPWWWWVVFVGVFVVVVTAIVGACALIAASHADKAWDRARR